MPDLIELKMSIMNQPEIDSKDSKILSLIEALEEKTYKLQEASREVEICHKMMPRMEQSGRVLNAKMIAFTPQLIELVRHANNGVTGSHTALWQAKSKTILRIIDEEQVSNG